jgi:transcriptional regulator with XRE-family HTH domain
MTSEETIANRLKQWRKSNGWTQMELADNIGVHVGMVRKWEGGTARPGSEALGAIGRAGVNLHWLILGEGEMGARSAGVPPMGKAVAAPMPRCTAGRCEDILKVILGIEDEGKREALLAEVHLRVRESAELDDLRRDVEHLMAAVRRGAEGEKRG